jgi:hypothetical protein
MPTTSSASSRSTKAKKAKRAKERTERRFLPESTINPKMLYAGIGLGALALGAGMYAYFLREPRGLSDAAITAGFANGEAYKTALDNAQSAANAQAFWMMSAGAIVLAIALWFTSSGEAALRVGVPGVALERGGVHRIPWYTLEALTWLTGEEAFEVKGRDEEDKPFSFQIKARAHTPGIAWLLKEAKDRLPSLLEGVPSDVLERFPEANANDGTVIIQPVQVVGKRCAISKRVIAYEPDARVCPNCECVYHMTHVPAVCACGNDLEHLQVS